MTPLKEALFLSGAMGLVILFCRAFPFFFGVGQKKPGKARSAFLDFVEKTVPPAAMTVLAVNALAAPFRTEIARGLPGLAAAVFTAAVHLWKRNALISIFGGTALYMILTRISF